MTEKMRHESVELELFTHRFESIARDMGEMLQRTALSTNVKERLDFSCALLDGAGRLVVNAPHIPVHLGALGLCVRGMMEEIRFEPGDTVVTNHPAFGGSHLPDVTVVSPVFAQDDDDLPVAFVANRAHHAEIGGTRPGSVPPDAIRLVEEGVVIPPMHLVRRGRACEQYIRALLLAPPYPSRAVEENLADLEAAAAANHLGVTAFTNLCTEHGSDRVQHFMDALRTEAARRMRETLAKRADGVWNACEYLDDGSPLRVRIEIRGDRATIDFQGSADVHPGNLNATPGIVHSVVLYVLRLMISEPLPLNEGLLAPIDLRIPHGILDPEYPADPALAPAVVGGNVETSQRLVDVVLRALELAACSQGTMNNVIFGDDSFGYYETVAGGAGAGPDHQGADAVHTHMTNTGITDPEVLEHRYPVRLIRNELRRGSGGSGRHRGGDGVVRELEFLAPAVLSILSQHRVAAPYGMEGGGEGKTGRQRVLRHDGRVVELVSVDGCRVEAGDRLLLETPGGGGWGRPLDEGEQG